MNKMGDQSGKDDFWPKMQWDYRIMVIKKTVIYKKTDYFFKSIFKLILNLKFINK